MASTPRQLIDIATRHQVMLERLKTGEWRELRRFVESLDTVIRDRLRGADSLTDFSLARLTRFERATAAALSEPITGFRRAWRREMERIALAEASFEVDSINSVLLRTTMELPTEQQVAAAVFSAPMQARGVIGDQLLSSFFRNWSQQTISQVNAEIRLGVTQGLTNRQIERAIRGTVAQNFTDGMMARVRRNAEAIVRTSVQHVSQQARQATWEQNSDIVRKVRFVATLDSRTTQQCSSLDGMEFPADKGPRPPLHVNCRSTTVAVLDDRLAVLQDGGTRAARNVDDRRQIDSVPAGETYYQWLQRQPESFQIEAIGPTRAALFRDGGLSAEEFSDLQLGRRFEPLTLEEMQRKQPAVFERAGIDVIGDE
jgi:SPP1 gp7 family putative phage head morphogenesis protein